MFKLHFLPFILFLLLAGSSMALAEKLTYDTANILEADIVSLYNPLGISLSAKAYHRQIYHHDAAVLWDGLYYQWGGQANINPAFSRFGVHAEWLPVAVVKLAVQYDRLFFSGNNGSLLAFVSSNDAFGDDALKAMEGDEVSAEGERKLLHITLQAKVDNIVVRNITDISDYKFPGNAAYYLEREYEILLAKDDQLISNQLYLLFEHINATGNKRYLGPYHDYIHGKKSGLTRERLGVTWFQQYTTALAGIQNPRWYLQSGIYLQDPNRQDEFYLVFGIGGDFEW